MMRSMRSELVRLRRRSVLLGWFGLSAFFAAMINVVIFTAPSEGSTGAPQPGGAAFPTADQLALSDGLVAGLESAATLFGVITLSYWAIVTATDYASGLVRLLVQAQPHRVRLLLGKVVALAIVTAIVATMVTVVSTAAALVVAPTTDISTELWSDGAAATVAGAWLNVYAALLVWGVIGLVIAVIARSSAVAISIGIGYVLVVEMIVGLVAEDAADWLPGATLTALASGGTAVVGYGTALALGAGYAAIGLVAASLTFARRDVTD